MTIEMFNECPKILLKVIMREILLNSKSQEAFEKESLNTVLLTAFWMLKLSSKKLHGHMAYIDHMA